MSLISLSNCYKTFTLVGSDIFNMLLLKKLNLFNVAESLFGDQLMIQIKREILMEIFVLAMLFITFHVKSQENLINLIR